MKTAEEITDALAELPGNISAYYMCRVLIAFDADGNISVMSAETARRLGAALIEAADWLDARAEQAEKEQR